ncbi:MAG: CBS domain-containing protein [Rhodospirillales bacterium]|nr:MAG: CBS domain-containing protein [Rhodospirillales bacterium]
MAIKTVLKNQRRGVITIKSTATAGDATWLLQQTGAGALIVTDNGRDIRGLVSGRDLIRALKTHGLDAMPPLTVAEIMRRNFATCRPEDSLRSAMTRMTARGLRHIAVVGDNGPCGVLSLAEVMKGRLHRARDEIAAACRDGALTT